MGWVWEKTSHAWQYPMALCWLAFLCRVAADTPKTSGFSTFAPWKIAEFGNLGHRVLLPQVLSLEKGEASYSSNEGLERPPCNASINFSPCVKVIGDQAPINPYPTAFFFWFYKYLLKFHYLTRMILGIRIKKANKRSQDLFFHGDLHSTFWKTSIARKESVLLLQHPERHVHPL